MQPNPVFETHGHYSCPNCVDVFAIPGGKLKRLPAIYRVRIWCCGCKQVLDLRAAVIDIVECCGPADLDESKVIEIIPSKDTSIERRDSDLHRKAYENYKKRKNIKTLSTLA